MKLHLSDDERLFCAVATAGAFVAARAGFETEAQAAVGFAAEQACRAVLPLLACEDPKLDVIVEQFADRIEVRLAYREGERAECRSGTVLSASAKDKLAESPAREDYLSKVDTVKHTKEGEICTTTLVKRVR